MGQQQLEDGTARPWQVGWPRLLRTIASDLQATELAKRVCRDLVEGFGFSRALIATVDEQHNYVVGRAGYDPHIPASVYMALLRLYRVPLAPQPDGRFLVAAWCVHHQEQAFIPDASCDSFRPTEATQRPYVIKALGTPSYAITPIVYRGRTVGVFAVDKKGQAANITTAELELMRDVAVVLSVRFGPLLQAELDANRRAPSLDVVLPEPNESNGHPHKRDELFQSALHDLKAPMQSILGFAELLQLGRGGALTPEQAEYVSRIVGGGDELLELIDRLLTINDLEAGRLDGSIEQIIAPRLVDSVVDRLQGKALRAHVCIACDIAADLPPLRGDWLQLGAVFQNLIANAIDAAKPGDLVRITGTHSTDGYARFAVTQMSSGSSEPPPLPFDPDWSRKGSSRRRSHGLGLAIVTRVVETYGGEVWAEGDLGAHFSIGFTLPLISAPMLRIARRA